MASQEMSFSRKMDWILAWVSIPLVPIALWFEWPSPGWWTFSAAICVPISFALAIVDFKIILGRLAFARFVKKPRR